MASSAIIAGEQRLDLSWLALAAFFVVLDMIIWTTFTAGSDWAPLWVAGQLALENPKQLYDFDLVAQLQIPLTGNADFHPYIYPPSALLAIAPVAALPFWPSVAMVAAGSLAWLGSIARKIGSEALLIALAPPVLMAAIVGQTSLLVIGMVVLACSLLAKDERKAGALFAVAALIKPTLLVLAPVGLVAGRHWRALGSAVVVGLAGVGLSVLLFGIQPWFDWIEAVPSFQKMFDDYPPLVRNAVSPYALAVRLGVEHGAIVAVGAVIAATIAWLAFRRPADAVTRSALLMGGALLLTPYAMNYELAALAPFMLAMPRERMREVLLIALWGLSLFANAGLLGLLIAYGLAASRVIGAGASQAKGYAATN